MRGARARPAGVTMFVRCLIVPMLGLLATAADTPPLKALASLQPGRWALTSRDGEFAARSICIGDPRALLQVRQPGPSCSHFVISDEPHMAVVHYTCPGAGHGRTTVRVETPRLAQVETQGIADNSPFDLDVEARRVGECQALSLR